MRRPLELLDERRVTLPADVSARELLEDLLRAGMVDALVELDGRTTESRFLDKTSVLTRPGILRRLATRLTALIGPQVERLAVSSQITLALGTAVALESGLPIVVVSEAEPFVSGAAYPGEMVAHIEDIVLTGASALRCVHALRTAGLNVVQVLSVIDRGLGATDLRAAGVDYAYLFALPVIQPERPT